MRSFRSGLSAVLPASILSLAVTAPAAAQPQNFPQRDAAGRTTVTESTTTQQQQRITAGTKAGDASLQLNLGWELADTDEGVRVEKIEENSAAAKAHLEEGDVIVKINDENVRTLDRVHAVLESVQQDDDDVNITVQRDGEELSYLLPLEGVDVVQTQRTTRSEQSLTEMLQLIQQQLQAQQATLDAILVEMQSQQGRPLNVQSTTSTNVPPAAGYSGDIIAPLGGGTGGVTPIQPQAPGNTGAPNSRPVSPTPPQN